MSLCVRAHTNRAHIAKLSSRSRRPRTRDMYMFGSSSTSSSTYRSVKQRRNLYYNVLDETVRFYKKNKIQRTCATQSKTCRCCFICSAVTAFAVRWMLCLTIPSQRSCVVKSICIRVLFIERQTMYGTLINTTNASSISGKAGLHGCALQYVPLNKSAAACRCVVVYRSINVNR